MKKQTSAMVVVALSLALVGCGTPQAQTSEQAKPQEEAVVSTQAPDTQAETPAAEPADAKTDDAAKDKTEVKQKLDERSSALAKAWEADLKKAAEDASTRVCIRAIDLESGATAGVESDRQMPSASMIKLIIAETLLKQASAGKLSLDDAYELDRADVVGGTGEIQGMAAGTKLDNRELLQQMIVSSDNTATNVIIKRVGMDAVNAEAKALDLKATKLQRLMMDLDAAKEGRDNFTSADDLAKLLQMVYDGTFVDKQSSKLMLEILEQQKDNDCISKGLPEGTKFAHKTGSGTTVRHDGGIVEGEHPFVLVCLCGDDGRFSEQAAMEAMANVGKVASADSNASQAG